MTGLTFSVSSVPTLLLFSFHVECSVEPTFKISAADVDVITKELEVTKEEAHAALLREKGDVVQALRHLCR